MSVHALPTTALGDPTMDDLEIAVAFGHLLLFAEDIPGAMQYASPGVTLWCGPYVPDAVPFVGAAGLQALFSEVRHFCETTDELRTEYYLAKPGLVIGRIHQSARHRGTGDRMALDRTEWLTVEGGLVADVQIGYDEATLPLLDRMASIS